MACTRITTRSFSHGLRMMQSSGLGDLGSGSGKSGGSGGTIREAGGAFGKMEAAREEEYFHKLKQAQLKALKAASREVEHHEQQIKDAKKRVEELEQEVKEMEKKKKK